jgi:hypothetical protein
VSSEKYSPRWCSDNPELASDRIAELEADFSVAQHMGLLKQVAELQAQLKAVLECKTYTIANPLGNGLVKMLYQHEVLAAAQEAGAKSQSALQQQSPVKPE